MYINPFVAGIIACVLGEEIILGIVAIVSTIVKRAKNAAKYPKNKR